MRRHAARGSSGIGGWRPVVTLATAMVVVALVSGAGRPAVAAEAADTGDLRIFVSLRGEPFDEPIIEVQRDDGDGQFDPAVDSLVADPTHPVEAAVEIDGLTSGTSGSSSWKSRMGSTASSRCWSRLNVTPLTRCFWGGEEPTDCEASEDDPPLTFVFIDNEPVIAGDGIFVITSRDDMGTPAEPFDDEPLEGAAFAVRQDDGDRRLDGSDDHLVDGLRATRGAFRHRYPHRWGVLDRRDRAPPGYRPAPPMLVELNTEPGLQCRWTGAAEPSCDEVDGDRAVCRHGRVDGECTRGRYPVPTTPPTDMETE